MPNLSSDLKLYGFEMRNGRVVQVEATNIRDAMARAEAEAGSVVSRGCEVSDAEPSIDQDTMDAIRSAWKGSNR